MRTLKDLARDRERAVRDLAKQALAIQRLVNEHAGEHAFYVVARLGVGDVLDPEVEVPTGSVLEPLLRGAGARVVAGEGERRSSRELRAQARQEAGANAGVGRRIV